MKLKRCACSIVAGLAVAVATLLGRSAWAEDRDLAFVHALQARGLGDVAVDYLDTLVKQPDCPPAIRDLFALEMSQSLRVQSQNIADPAQREALQAKAQQFLDEFTKQHPNHPEALQAELVSAEMIFEQGKESWIAGRGAKDKANAAAKLAAGRKSFEQSAVMFKAVADKLADRLAKVPTVKPKPKTPLTRAEKETLATRAGYEAALARAGGEAALVNYFIAQTYPDPADNLKRKIALSIAAKALDAIYQRHRGDNPNSPAGRAAIVAHVWNGKAVEELGDPKTANDIYDEVLENLPEPGENLKEGPTGMEDVLAQAKHFSLLLLEKNPYTEKLYVTEAKKFLADYKKNFRTEWGYQAIEFELAKYLLAAAAKSAKPSDRTQFLRDGLQLLNDMKPVRSEFQNEAILLYFNLEKSKQNGAEPKTADEAIALADPELQRHHWAEAEAYYRKALALLDPKKDAVRIAQVQDALASCQLLPIYEQWQKWTKEKQDYDAKQFLAWTDGVERVASENKKSDTGLKAAGLGVYFSWMIYIKADGAVHAAPDKKALAAATAEKDEAAKRLQGVVEFTTKTFPGTPEADEARMSLARMKSNDGAIDEALAAFEAINPKSDKYPEALQTIGKIRLYRYYQEMKKPPTQRNAKQLAEDRALALEHLAASANHVQEQLKPGDPIPADLIETKLLLAQVRVDGGEFAEAAQMLQPLVELIIKAHPKQLDDTMLKVFGTLVRAYLGLHDFEKAGAAGAVLIDLGPDEPIVNGVLIQFVQRLDIERKKLEIELAALPDKTPMKEVEALRGRLNSVNVMLSKMVLKLSGRQALNARSMYFIGKEFLDVEDFDNAERQLKAFLKRAEVDPDFNKEAAPLMNLVLTRLIDISRKKGNFVQAVAEVQKLRQKFPKNLDVMMTEAQIYQDWGEKKDPKQLDVAAGKWSEVRRLLSPQKKNPKYADAYYEVLYNSAYCLFVQAKKLSSSDRTQAMAKTLEGEKVLNSEMVLNTKLNGPLTVQRFNGLMAQLQAFLKNLQGNAPAAATSTSQDQ